MRRMDEETEYKTWVHPVPSFDAEIPVKLNAATILRDEQVGLPRGSASAGVATKG